MTRRHTGQTSDPDAEREAIRTAGQVRARRMDKPLAEVARYARAEVQRDCITYLMSRRPQED